MLEKEPQLISIPTGKNLFYHTCSVPDLGDVFIQLCVFAFDAPENHQAHYIKAINEISKHNQDTVPRPSPKKKISIFFFSNNDNSVSTSSVETKTQTNCSPFSNSPTSTSSFQTRMAKSLSISYLCNSNESWRMNLLKISMLSLFLR